jgi:hypothetical protein
MRFEDLIVSELSQWLEEVSKLLYPFVAGFSGFWILDSDFCLQEFVSTDQ